MFYFPLQPLLLLSSGSSSVLVSSRGQCYLVYAREDVTIYMYGTRSSHIFFASYSSSIPTLFLLPLSPVLPDLLH
ncbi:hypothetical protein HD806DRAFT_497880 [Xylariaceae sp. AK1471]|nr:hypothetical protein HD806DRAFT_497880 [Xylariaceae sp. AK1471]